MINKIERDVREKTIFLMRRWVIDLIEEEPYPPRETDNNLHYHLTQEDFDVWKNRVVELINNRLPNSLLT